MNSFKHVYLCILCVQYYYPEIATVNIFQIRLNFISLPVEFTCLYQVSPVNSQGAYILGPSHTELGFSFDLIYALLPCCLLLLQSLFNLVLGQMCSSAFYLKNKKGNNFSTHTHSYR